MPDISKERQRIQARLAAVTRAIEALTKREASESIDCMKKAPTNGTASK